MWKGRLFGQSRLRTWKFHTNLHVRIHNFTRIYTWEFAISPEFTRETSQFHTKKIFMPLMLINSWEKNTCEMNFRRVEIVSHCPNNRPRLIGSLCFFSNICSTKKNSWRSNIKVKISKFQENYLRISVLLNFFMPFIDK